MADNSIDPRVNRIAPEHDPEHSAEAAYWESYEVFHQEKRGKHPVHVGSVRASDPDLAMVFAKEQYARRKTCTNLWVVRSAEIFSLSAEDEIMFSTTTDKMHREASLYKVRDKITAYREKQNKQ